VRDVRRDLGGYVALVTDTVGLREATGAIEREGIRRARRRAEEADLIVWISDATAPFSEIPADLAARAPRMLRVLNKIDAADAHQDQPADHAISALTGAGLSELVEKLGEIVSEAAGAAEAPPITQLRHRQHIEACLEALSKVHLIGDIDTELVAEQLRLAADALGRIVGRIDPEDVLDQIFTRFCIGK
jgi:tRNA modification GTPase